MSRRLYFISHPNVVVDPTLPVPRWPLSKTGRARMIAGLVQSWVPGITSIYSSTEQKAIDSAEILADHLSIEFRQEEGLGENDRSSTGFLPPQEFESVANEFFAHPNQSVRGWERAIDAQARIVNAVSRLAREDRTHGSIAIVSHGAIGTLLHCWLAGNPISRQWDQPASGGGNFYPFALSPPAALAWWSPFDLGAA
jgi:broad specificity phosphatase PhoE